MTSLDGKFLLNVSSPGTVVPLAWASGPQSAGFDARHSSEAWTTSIYTDEHIKDYGVIIPSAHGSDQSTTTISVMASVPVLEEAHVFQSCAFCKVVPWTFLYVIAVLQEISRALLTCSTRGDSLIHKARSEYPNQCPSDSLQNVYAFFANKDSDACTPDELYRPANHKVLLIEEVSDVSMTVLLF